MDMGLNGRRALVLAGTDGLGRAVARGLTAEGARVVVGGRSQDRARACVEAGDAWDAVLGDQQEAGATAHVVTEAIGRLGGLDILVVNTGGGKPGGIMDTQGHEEDAWANMLRPALEAARTAAPALRQSPGSGRLLFLTARSVLEASPELALSSVMRSGVRAAARSLALELAPDVLVNVLVTGQFETGALQRFQQSRTADGGATIEEVRAEDLSGIPLARFGRVEELADPVVFLCSARASFITGTTLRVDGGAIRGF